MSQKINFTKNFNSWKTKLLYNKTYSCYHAGFGTYETLEVGRKAQMDTNI